MLTKPSYEELEEHVRTLRRREADLEQKLASLPSLQKELLRLRDYLGHLCGGMYEEYMVIDRQLTITDVNEPFLATYGGTRESNIGRKCHAVTHKVEAACSDEDHPCPVRMVFGTSRPVRVEHRHCNDKGELTNVEIYAFPLFGEDGRVERVVELHHDVTARHEAESGRVLREKAQAVLELAGAVCHELHQPMQVVLVCAERLVKGLPPGDANQELAANIQASVGSMARITRKLARISRYEAIDYVQGTKIIDIAKASDDDE